MSSEAGKEFLEGQLSEHLFPLLVKNLTSDLFRKGLTIFAISISISLVISLISITIGLREEVRSSLERMGQNVFVVSPNNFLIFEGFTQADLEGVRRIPEVKSVVGMYVVTSQIQRGENQILSRAVGLSSDDKKILIDEGYYGISIGPSPSRVSKPISLGFSLWNEVGEPHLLEKIKILGMGEYKLESVFRSTGRYEDDFSVFLPIEDVWGYKNVSTYSFLSIFVSNPNIQNSIEAQLEKSRGVNDFSVSDNKKKLEDTQSIISLLEWFFVAISMTSIIVSGVGVANTFYIEVAEQKSYIGVLKALGATDDNVVFLFLVESSIMGALGGLLGVLFASFSTSVIAEIAKQKSVFLTPVIPNWLWLGSIVLGMGIAVLFAITPAKKAAQLDPVEVLR